MEGPLKCPQCPSRFLSAGPLALHQEVSHPDERSIFYGVSIRVVDQCPNQVEAKTLECTHCTFATTDASSLEQHMSQSHQEVYLEGFGFYLIANQQSKKPEVKGTAPQTQQGILARLHPHQQPAPSALHLSASNVPKSAMTSVPSTQYDPAVESPDLYSNFQNMNSLNDSLAISKNYSSQVESHQEEGDLMQTAEVGTSESAAYPLSENWPVDVDTTIRGGTTSFQAAFKAALEKDYSQSFNGQSRTEQIFEQGNADDQVYDQNASEQVYHQNASEQVYNQNPSEQVYGQNSSKQVYLQSANEQVNDNKSSEQVYHKSTTQHVYSQIPGKQVYHQNTSEQVYDQNPGKQVFHQSASEQVYDQNPGKQVFHQSTSKQVYDQNPVKQVFHQSTSEQVFDQNPGKQVFHQSASEQVFDQNPGKQVFHQSTSEQVYDQNPGKHVFHQSTSDQVYDQNPGKQVFHQSTRDQVYDQNPSKQLFHQSISEQVYDQNSVEQVFNHIQITSEEPSEGSSSTCPTKPEIQNLSKDRIEATNIIRKPELDTNMNIEAHKRANVESSKPNVENGINASKASSLVSKQDEASGASILKPMKDPPETDYDNVCKLCGKRFLRLKYLLLHHRQSHPKEKREACSLCELKFFEKSSLQLHILNVHMLRCCICETYFSDGIQHLTHMRIKHNGIGACRCGKCKKLATTPTVFVKTMETAKEEKSENTLKESDLTTGGIVITCDVCKKEFKSITGMKLHITRKHTPTPMPIQAGQTSVSIPKEQITKEKKIKGEVKATVLNYVEDEKPDEPVPGKTPTPTKKPPTKKRTAPQDLDGSSSCKLCSKVCSKPQYLRIHMMKKHDIVMDKPSKGAKRSNPATPKKEGFNCDDCSMFFPQFDQYKFHRLLVHDEEDDETEADTLIQEPTTVDGAAASLKPAKPDAIKKKQVNSPNKSGPKHTSTLLVTNTSKRRSGSKPSTKSRAKRSKVDYFPETSFLDDLTDDSNDASSHLRNDDKPVMTIIICEICRKVFATDEKLQNHRLNVHKITKRKKSQSQNQETEPLICKVCKKVESSHEKLKQHLFKNHGIGDLSQKNLALVTEKENHPSKRSRSDKVWHCNRCSQVFHSRGTYLLHTSQTHLFDEEPKIKAAPVVWPCDYCDESFAKKFHLRTHVNSFHSVPPDPVDAEILGQREWKCDFCSKSFFNHSTLIWHASRYHQNKSSGTANKSSSSKIPCDQCQKVFKRRDKLKAHIKRMHSSKIAPETLSAETLDTL